MTGESINCSLIFQTNNMTLDVMIDYGDGETTLISAINSTTPILLTKLYAMPGFYNILFESSYNTRLNYTIQIRGGTI